MLKPLIKWAGGKRQIMPHLLASLPDHWETYFEPFAGGLALLVELHNAGNLSKAVISDTNPELINLYVTVKDYPEELIEALGELGDGNHQNTYYERRDWFNEIRDLDENAVKRAALFLYLNRHSYNGLWRVNSSGEFNVPFGKYRNPTLPSAGQIREFSEMLRNVRIMLCDFREAIQTITPDDFAYFDPPYFPVSRTAAFTDYTRGGFGTSEQVRLMETCRNLEKAGIRFLVSNSFSEKIADLYEGFIIRRIEAKRSINSKSDLRSGHSELLISDF